ncbi:hypothetical protein BFJ63_vAg17825 [Fusarium oxysporum f. sp. narcissi]|uniref:Uncharacterized protein n=1 Tax=Fusarium oxysporum f. sp. narcissi TaxID=451672 RepID=A0A4Q2UXP5_FUSOX|nr:hypothetical protein BFJ63_vAg17825 [Fusarium oxysporum f. sp. narcissi]
MAQPRGNCKRKRERSSVSKLGQQPLQDQITSENVKDSVADMSFKVNKSAYYSQTTIGMVAGVESWKSGPPDIDLWFPASLAEIPSPKPTIQRSSITFNGLLADTGNPTFAFQALNPDLGCSLNTSKETLLQNTAAQAFSTAQDVRSWETTPQLFNFGSATMPQCLQSGGLFSLCPLCINGTCNSVNIGAWTDLSECPLFY